MTAPTLTETQAPPTTERATLPPPDGLQYVIVGRPGWKYTSVEEACRVAADLVTRLRLSQTVKVREAGSERIVAMAGTDGNGGATVVRLVGTA